MTRCQVVQPWSVIVTLVADGEIDGRPASKKVLPVASDSTREARADEAEDGVVVDDLGRERRRLVRTALRVELLQVDLAVGVVGVVLLQRQLDAVDHVLAESTGVTGERAEEREVLAAEVAAVSVAAAVSVVGAARDHGKAERQRRDAGSEYLVEPQDCVPLPTRAEGQRSLPSDVSCRGNLHRLTCRWKQLGGSGAES